MTYPHVVSQLAQAARQRCDRFVVSSLEDLFTDAPSFLDLPPSVLTALAEHRTEARRIVSQWVREAAVAPAEHPAIAFMSFHTRRFLKNNHQFLVLTAALRRDLAALYLQLLVAAERVLGEATSRSLATQLQATIALHRERLRTWIARCGLTPSSSATPRPICWEYTPEVQLAVLGLDVRAVAGPVLDLGCGEDALLVRYLRRRGVAAWGLDAFAGAGDPHVLRGEWLFHHLGAACWSTVLSHMAFSNHFLHHHLADDALSLAYAHRYMVILDSLTPSGCFIYAPGLPFLEELLPPDHYRVERHPIAGVYETLLDRELAQRIGRSTFYRACVRRLR